MCGSWCLVGVIVNNAEIMARIRHRILSDPRSVSAIARETGVVKQTLLNVINGTSQTMYVDCLVRVCEAVGLELEIKTKGDGCRRS